MPRPTEITTIPGTKDWQGLLSLREARSVRISSADITADAKGKKIVPAGSILGSATADQTILGNNAPAKIVNDATAEGLLVNEVDVTGGDAEAAMAFVATASVSKLPVAPADAAKTAMNRITFMDV